MGNRKIAGGFTAKPARLASKRISTVTGCGRATLTIPPAQPFPGYGAEREVHVILEVWDDGTPALVAYRRAVVTVRP